MKPYRSWGLDKRRDFVERYLATAPRSAERKALQKEAGITEGKNASSVIQKLRNQIVIRKLRNRMEPANGNQASLPIEEAPIANGVSPRGKFSPEDKRRLVLEWLALAEGKPPRDPEMLRARREFVKRNRLQDWMMTQWSAALGLRPSKSGDVRYRGQTSRKWINQAGSAAKAKKKAKPHTVIKPDTHAKKAATRKITAKQRIQYMDTYSSLPTRQGERFRYCESIGVPQNTMAYWLDQRSRGRIVGSRGRVVGHTKHVPERETEEIDTGQPEEKKSTKASYDKLLRQNLILKGLLKLAQDQGFDLESILEFRGK